MPRLGDGLARREHARLFAAFASFEIGTWSASRGLRGLAGWRNYPRPDRVIHSSSSIVSTPSSRALASFDPAPGPATTRTKETIVAEVDEALNQDWTVSFEANRGAPETLQFDRLIWSESADVGVKYFSGSASYAKTIEVPAGVFAPDAHLWLDLGDVEDIADVSVNGKEQGIVWKTPFRIDVTQSLVAGQQPDRGGGDEPVGEPHDRRSATGALKQYAFADFTPYKAGRRCCLRACSGRCDCCPR